MTHYNRYPSLYKRNIIMLALQPRTLPWYVVSHHRHENLQRIPLRSYCGFFRTPAPPKGMGKKLVETVYTQSRMFAMYVYHLSTGALDFTTTFRISRSFTSAFFRAIHISTILAIHCDDTRPGIFVYRGRAPWALNERSNGWFVDVGCSKGCESSMPSGND